MAAKVEANISDFLDYASEFYLFGLGENAPSGISFEGLNGLIENLTNLDWKAPFYDQTLPVYNLRFYATKTADSPSGIFTINHKVTGDYIDSEDYTYVENGSITDSITASYGSSDKSTLTVSNSVVTKFDANEDITSNQTSSTFNQSITSSNNSLDNKSDDYVRTTSYNYSFSDNVKNDMFAKNYKYSDTYKSAGLNYTNTWSSKESGTSGSTDLFSLTSKIDYSNKDNDSGTSITANVAYSHTNKYLNDNYISILNFSSATFNIVSEDMYSISFSGGVTTSNDETSINLKNVTLETSSFKMLSANISMTNVDSESSAIFYDIENILSNNSDGISPADAIISSLDTLLTLNQSDNTITIKSSEGVEIDAGRGKDVVLGGKGDDIITGGTGADKLTGGKGLDVFKFAFSDFFSEDANGNPIFDKSLDTITDFSLRDGDYLEFGEIGQLTFYKTLSAAKSEEAQLFYVKGQIYFNADSSGKSYLPTVIVTLTGSPALNADGTDFNYPSV
jgi:Ca2+-binding RTX toxin-like protein